MESIIAIVEAMTLWYIRGYNYYGVITATMLLWIRWLSCISLVLFNNHAATVSKNYHVLERCEQSAQLLLLQTSLASHRNEPDIPPRISMQYSTQSGTCAQN